MNKFTIPSNYLSAFKYSNLLQSFRFIYFMPFGYKHQRQRDLAWGSQRLPFSDHAKNLHHVFKLIINQRSKIRVPSGLIANPQNSSGERMNPTPRVVNPHLKWAIRLHNELAFCKIFAGTVCPHLVKLIR